MNILIVEDQSYQSDILCTLLKKCREDIHIVGSFTNSADVISFYKEKPSIDLLFLDVELEDGHCFKLFDSVDITCPVVFTTSYRDYSIEAFYTNCIHYLLKPITQNKLTEALEKYQNFEQMFQPKHPIIGTSSLVHGTSVQSERKIVLKVGSKNMIMKESDIAYFHLENKMVYLYQKSGKHFIIDFTLEELRPLLSDQFYRVNRQLIVNLDSIKKFYSYTRGRIKLDLIPELKKENLLVSFKNRKLFLEWVKSSINTYT